MPIYKGREFIERLNKGNEPYIRRTEKAKELTYGLYDIRYFDGQNAVNDYSDHLKSQSSYKKLYAWGKNRWLPTLPEDPDDYEYLTHNFGWYNKPDYSLKQTYKDDRPMIDYREHINLDLYAKWRQKRFQFEGTIMMYGGGDYTLIPTKGGMPTGNYTWDEAKASGYIAGMSHPYSSTDGWGQCINWIYDRAGAPRLSGGSFISTYGYASTIRQGDIACWGVTGEHSYGHVAVVEQVLADGRLVVSNGNYRDGSGETRPDGKSDYEWGVNNIHVTIIDLNGNPIGNSAGNFLGIAKNPNRPPWADDSGIPEDELIEGEEFEIEPVEVYVDRQDVPDQKNPYIPDPLELGYEDGEWIEQTSYTMERTTEYDDENWGHWTGWEDKYVEDGENFHLEWEDY